MDSASDGIGGCGVKEFGVGGEDGVVGIGEGGEEQED